MGFYHNVYCYLSYSAVLYHSELHIHIDSDKYISFIMILHRTGNVMIYSFYSPCLIAEYYLKDSRTGYHGATK